MTVRDAGGDGSDTGAGTGDDAPSMEDLAKRCLDLWQEQAAAVAADPETAETMGRLFESMRAQAETFGAAVFGGARAGPAAKRDAADGRDGEDRETAAGGAATGTPHGPSATGAASAGAASRDRDGDVDALRRRVLELEARLAALEARS